MSRTTESARRAPEVIIEGEIQFTGKALNDQDAQAEFERVKKECRTWASRIGLDRRIDLDFNMQRGEPGIAGPNELPGSLTVLTRWHWLTAFINVNVDMTKLTIDPEERSRNVIHELMHVQVAAMSPNQGTRRTRTQEQQEELTCDLLTESILNAYNAGVRNQ
jgi:hypothetical protein